MPVQNSLFQAAVFGLAFLAPAAAMADPNLVQNGNFEQTSMTDGMGNFTPEQITTTNLADWSTTGYNFVFGANTASTVGSTGQYGQVSMYNGSAVPGGAILGVSPTGGNFVGADGAYDVGAITQTLTGLTKGASYAVSFSWAGVQQSGFTGITTEQWIVGFGGETQATQVVTDASHGFTGWMNQTFVFQADGTSDVLSFLAAGTPPGEPPFSLLDGVSAKQVAVPEPATLAILAGALTVFIGFTVRRARNT